MITFLHTFNPQPIALDLGIIHIHWYGILMVIAISAGLGLAIYLGKQYNLSSDNVIDIAFYGIICGLIGARIYAIFLSFDYYVANPQEIIAVWHGGLAIHGALIGGAIATIAYCIQHRQSWWRYADISAPALAVGQAIGRWGNYFNQEIFGRPTDLPWGIPISLANRPLEYLSSSYFHPTFLYESLLDVVSAIILITLHRFKFKNSGIIAGIYLINYGVIRAAMEQLRVDETIIVYGIRGPILVSGGLIIVGIGVIIYRLYFTKPTSWFDGMLSRLYNKKV